MNAWMAMVKKEMRLGQTMFGIGFGLALILAGISAWLAGKSPVVFTAGMWMSVLAFYVVSLPIYMIASIAKEANTRTTWLQAPLSGWSLLTAKLVSGVVYLLATVVPTSFFVRLALDRGSEALQAGGEYESFLTFLLDLRSTFVPTLLLVIYLSISLATVTTAITVLLQAFRTQIRRGRALIGLALFVLFLIGLNAVSETSIYQTLMNWGQIATFGPALDSEPLYIGDTLFEVVVMLLLVTGAGRLLDRKVGV
jgi:hypothetical protein